MAICGITSLSAADLGGLGSTEGDPRPQRGPAGSWGSKEPGRALCGGVPGLLRVGAPRAGWHWAELWEKPTGAHFPDPRAGGRVSSPPGPLEPPTLAARRSAAQVRLSKASDTQKGGTACPEVTEPAGRLHVQGLGDMPGVTRGPLTKGGPGRSHDLDPDTRLNVSPEQDCPPFPQPRQLHGALQGCLNLQGLCGHPCPFAGETAGPRGAGSGDVIPASSPVWGQPGGRGLTRGGALLSGGVTSGLGGHTQEADPTVALSPPGPRGAGPGWSGSWGRGLRVSHVCPAATAQQLWGPATPLKPVGVAEGHSVCRRGS